jgi:hypothetical protein
MHTRWKVLIAAAMVLPTGAFVVGSLVASAADRPTERDTIVIQDPATPTIPVVAPRPSPGDDRGDDRGDGPDGAEDVGPQYDDLDDGVESDDNGGGRDDRSGSGRGGHDDGPAGPSGSGDPGDPADHGGSGTSSSSGFSTDD